MFPAGRLSAVATGILMAVGSGMLTGCLLNLRPPGPPSLADSVVARSRLAAALATYWQSALSQRPDLAMALGRPVEAVPSHSNVAARSAALLSVRLLPALEEINVAALTPREFVTLQSLQKQLETGAAAYTFFDLDLSLLSPRLTPLRTIVDVLRRHPLQSTTDVERYLFLLDGATLWVSDVRGALEGRRARGVVAPLDAALAFARSVRELRQLTAGGALHLPEARLAILDSASRALVRTREAEALTNQLLPAMDSLVTWLEGPYTSAALPRPGLWQYAGGKEYYRHLVRHYSGLEIEPKDAHEAGLSELQRIDSLLAVVRRQAGWNPLPAVLHDSLRRTARLARVPLDTVLARIMARQPLIAERLGVAIAPLPLSMPRLRTATPLEAWLYPEGHVVPPLYADSATTVLATGQWTGPDALLNDRGLGFRWLWPGAALAATIGFTAEQGSGFVLLHPSAATQDGWTEYAASLAGELGMYAEPLDAYARLLAEGLNAALLVVDSGIHYFGWTKEQGLLLLRRYSLAEEGALDAMLVERIVATPGRAGAAVLGAREFAAMRAWMQGALGSDYSGPAFHAELLSLGPAPLPVLAAHLEWWEWLQRNGQRRAK
jgi:uncharacterized protein (DUF885 family)